MTGVQTCALPIFMDEINENAGKAPKNGLTGMNHLRSIVGTIGAKYDPELTAWSIRPNVFEGRPFGSNKELSNIVVELLKSQYPKIFDSYLHHAIKNRPASTKLIYYVGNFNSTTAFFQNGIDNIDEKDVETYLGLKPKKTVGKPAVTKEQVEENETE